MTQFNLEDRTINFAKSVIDIAKKLQKDCINRRMISQVIASAGSVGANYCEATECESKKDFVHKVAIAKKEVKETKHWLLLLCHANSQLDIEFKKVLQESQELLLILSKIIVNTKKLIA